MNPIALTIFLLVSFSFGVHPLKMPEYIKFDYIGQQNSKPIRPLYISTSKLDIKLDSLQYAMLKAQLQALKKPLTKEVEERFLNTQDNFIITDQKTYSLLHSFISTHKDFYADFVYINGSPDEFSITMDQKSFPLLSKFTGAFFEKLTKSLKSGHCDKNVIRAINEL